VVSRLSVAPNPFADLVRIEICPVSFATIGWPCLPGAQERIVAAVYAPSGQRVRVLETRPAAGAHAWCWDGRDDRGARLPAGSYWIRVQYGSAVQRAPVRLVR